MGCVGGRYVYTPPMTQAKISNSVTVDEPKEQIWKRAIVALSSSFYVINNLDKESGLINLSYSGNPEKCIDCGEIDSYVKNLAGERRYKFPASTEYKEYELMQGTTLYGFKRKMDLEGRINIVIQEISETQSLVSVNIKYIVTKNNLIYDMQGRSENSSETITFNTNGHETFNQSKTVCYATTYLEKEIFEILGIK
jgi:hypothetical protein